MFGPVGKRVKKTRKSMKRVGNCVIGVLSAQQEGNLQKKSGDTVIREPRT